MGTEITFIVQGQERIVNASRGPSVMDVAVRAGIPGIVGECGGNASCATCHVYLPDSRVEEFPVMSEEEDEMLDESFAERRDTSRLACQLPLECVGTNLCVTVPDSGSGL